MNKGPFIVSAIVILLLAFYYFVQIARPINLTYINAVVAFGATIIIGISFFLGPLASFIKPAKKWLASRKQYGLIGFSLVVVHTILVVPIILAQESSVLLSDVTSLAFAGVAFVLFLLMAMTSRQEWITKLGYNNWKDLQRIGYVAFPFMLFHIVLIRQGFFIMKVTGQVVITFVLLILLLRAISLILNIHHKEKTKI